MTRKGGIAAIIGTHLGLVAVLAGVVFHRIATDSDASVAPLVLMVVAQLITLPLLVAEHRRRGARSTCPERRHD